MVLGWLWNNIFQINQTLLNSTCSLAGYFCNMKTISGTGKAKKKGPAFQCRHVGCPEVNGVTFPVTRYTILLRFLPTFYLQLCFQLRSIVKKHHMWYNPHKTQQDVPFEIIRGPNQALIEVWCYGFIIRLQESTGTIIAKIVGDFFFLESQVRLYQVHHLNSN